MLMSAPARFGVMAGLFDQALRIGEPHKQAEDHDQHDAADPLSGHELPAHEQIENDAELGDEVGRCENESQARDESRPFLKQGSANSG